MKRETRVLHVMGTLNIGGAETFVMNLYRAVDREKIQFDFVVHYPRKTPYADEIRTRGGRIYGGGR